MLYIQKKCKFIFVNHKKNVFLQYETESGIIAF